jgi:hypothetical protein
MDRGGLFWGGSQVREGMARAASGRGGTKAVAACLCVDGLPDVPDSSISWSSAPGVEVRQENLAVRGIGEKWCNAGGQPTRDFK